MQLREALPISAALLLLPALLALLSVTPAYAGHDLLADYESGDRLFEEVEIGDRLVVYFHQRMIGEVTVEKDLIVYQFNRYTGELLDRKAHWREDLPGELPPLALTREEAELMVAGEVEFAKLYIISPESDVFPIDPTPRNPCWVVRSIDGGSMIVTVIDAVDGVILGDGVPPPYSGFSLTGPWYFTPCQGAWSAWSSHAVGWFNTMGYSTEHIVWPEEEEIRGHVESTETAMFYELAHGWHWDFAGGCVGGQNAEHTTAGEIQNWIRCYEKMPFAFIGSCEGMCSTGNNTLSYEFRKGSMSNTATVGYCGMSGGSCGECWLYSLDWQESLFHYMSLGYTVKEAFDQANADYPMCPSADCMRFAGDEEFTVVPVVERDVSVWTDVTSGPLGDSGHGYGVAWGDYDNDGDLDLFLANWGSTCKLLRNDGGGVFVDATAGPLDFAGHWMGVVWGDYDNDGDLDLYLANQGPNMLFRNDDGTFVDVTNDPLDDSGYGSAVGWGDYDNDGDLDLYLVKRNSANRLFRNEGGDVFVDATTPPLGDSGYGTGMAWGDYDGDGDLDLYLANDGNANKLFRNDGAGVFVDATSGPLGDTDGGYGVAWGDYDNDGDLDLYLVNSGSANKLFRNDGGDVFVDATTDPLGDTGFGRGVAWMDRDNDGDLDLYVVNQQGNGQMFDNQGGGEFVGGGCGPACDPGEGNGVACGDYDNDGDLDMYLANMYGTNRLLRNDDSSDNHWLHVHLAGTVSNHFGVGARVRVVTGRTSRIREVSAGSGYLSQNSLAAEFGLGAATVVDTVEVCWPSGLVTKVHDLAVDQFTLVAEMDWSDVAGEPATEGQTAGDPGNQAEHSLGGSFPNPFDPITLLRENTRRGGTEMTIRGRVWDPASTSATWKPARRV
jgi:hypothetical protein